MSNMYVKPVSSNYLEDNSDRTNLLKDRVIPNLKSTGFGMAGAAIGGTLGAGLALGTKKGTVAMAKKMVSPETTKFIKKNLSEAMAGRHKKYVDTKALKSYSEKPMKLLFSEEMMRARNIGTAAGGAIAGGRAGSRVGEVLGNTSRLREMHRGQFGVEPSEGELFESARLSPDRAIDRKMYKYFFTPEAMTKSTFRNVRQNNNFNYALDPREVNNNNNNSYPMHMDRNRSNFKMADNSDFGIEKIANLSKIKKAYSGFQKNLKKMTPAINKGEKLSPIIGGGAGAISLAGPGVVASNIAVDREDKHSKKKKAAITALAMGAGAATGGAIAKDTASLAKSLHGKLQNPDKVVVEGVKKYMNFFKNSFYDYKEEIEKKAANGLQMETDRAMNQRGFSDSDFKSFADRMNRDYSANTYYKKNNDVNYSYAIKGENLKGLPENMRTALGVPVGGIGNKSFVQSAPLEEIMLHETGHIKDKNLKNTTRKANMYSAGATLTSLAGGGLSAMLDNPYASAGVGAVGVGGGTLLKDMHGRTVEKREDDANEFVKDYYTKKLGSRELAEKHIKENTVIPTARKTYRKARITGDIAHAALYGAPTAMNVARKFAR